jgi:hypothetical protein
VDNHLPNRWIERLGEMGVDNLVELEDLGVRDEEARTVKLVAELFA